MVTLPLRSRPPRTPINTYAADVHPLDVRVGDSVLLDGVYHPIRDMRSAGPGGEKVLIFDAHAPWRMAQPHRVFRPIERGTTGLEASPE